MDSKGCFVENKGNTMYVKCKQSKRSERAGLETTFSRFQKKKKKSGGFRKQKVPSLAQTLPTKYFLQKYSFSRTSR
jgi:hypothetical protein